MQYLAIIKFLRGLCAPSLEVIIPKGLRLLYRSETHAFFFYNIDLLCELRLLGF